MAFLRSDRVQSLIHHELSLLIVRELEFSGALVTVTSVEVDKKMERALIGISVLPPEKFKEVLKNLRDHAGELQHLLLKKINIKPMPYIIFKEDRGFEEAAKVEKLLLDK